VTLFVVASARDVHAQGLDDLRAAPVGSHLEARRTLADDTAANSTGAFVLEALGGSLGSLAGIGIVALAAHCGHEDLGCVILNVGAGGALGAVGATIGTTLVARHTKSARSVTGAALGALVGTGVGLGLHYAFNHSSDRNLGDAVTVPIFVISQGAFAALGSRLLGQR
jgi:hypothetical protein